MVPVGDAADAADAVDAADAEDVTATRADIVSDAIADSI